MLPAGFELAIPGSERTYTVRSLNSAVTLHTYCIHSNSNFLYISLNIHNTENSFKYNLYPVLNQIYIMCELLVQ
jgi:hypothetical protein